MDCLEGMKQIPDKSIDLIVTDPPYILENQGGGFWGNDKKYNSRGTRQGMAHLQDIKDGISTDMLDEMCRVMKKINIYLFCSQKQLPIFIDYFVRQKGCNWNLLTWHKTNPIPACGNKYLNDTEYILFFREKGVPLFGTFETKRTFFAQLRNMEEDKWHHPTIKPLNIVETLVINSSTSGGVILDPFMGSGTTAIACIKGQRHYIGFELNEEYYKNALKRIEAETIQGTLF